MMASSNSRRSDLLRRSSSSSASASTSTTRPQSTNPDNNVNTGNLGSMTLDGILRDAYGPGPTTESTILDGSLSTSKSMDDVWKDMISGERRECKEEALDEMMTLEDFLAKAEAVEDEDDDDGDDIGDVKIPVVPTERMMSGDLFTFQSFDKFEGSLVGFDNGGIGERSKRGRPVLEPLDKAALQRQRRMIKNRESAARSRERKQAYQVELESIAVRLEEENEQLMREKAERTKKRYKQLMERVIPIAEKPKQPRVLRRVRSWQW